MSEQLPCQAIFGQERGREVHEFVERMNGATCPCLSGEQCLLLDGKGDSPLLPDSVLLKLVPRRFPGQRIAIGMSLTMANLAPLAKALGVAG